MSEKTDLSPIWTFDQTVAVIAAILTDNINEEALSDDDCYTLAEIIAKRLEKGP